MEDFDIEELNFEEYNREVYLERNPIQDKQAKQLSLSQAFDAQKRYKLEIDKFVSEYKKGLARNEIEESDLEHVKKRKY